jgi:hypothetical protein
VRAASDRKSLPDDASPWSPPVENNAKFTAGGGRSSVSHLEKDADVSTLFDALWANYPSSDPCDAKSKGVLVYKNQCAIRVSYAMRKSGIGFETYKKAKCGAHPREHHVLAAVPLADWIDQGNAKGVGRSIDITGADWEKKVADRTGIICFEDYWARDGETKHKTGDHIDLWNGSRLTHISSWFRIHWDFVIPGIWSDFAQAKRIRFFEVK